MAQCKSSPQEFIQDAFSPLVAVLCSHDAELICQKNNLSFVELIQPFCRINTEASIRDPSNVSHNVRNLRINVRDMNLNPPQPTLIKKMLNEATSNALPPNFETPRNSVISVGAYDLQLSSTTPWFEAFRECFLQTAYPSEHEFLKHFLACIFVVSSSHAEPMDQFMKLTQQQHLQHQQQPAKLPRWFCPNVLRYYVLIHDVTEEENAKAETIYQTMKQSYGINNCHLLRINSRAPDAPDDATTKLGSMPDPWSQYMPKKQENNEGSSYDNVSIAESSIFPSHVQEGQPSEKTSLSQSESMLSLDGVVDSAFEATEETNTEGEPPDTQTDPLPPQTSLVVDHPLAPDIMDSHSNNSSPQPDNMILRDSQNNPLPDLTTGQDKPPRSAMHGGCLTLSDHDRLRIFINEFMVRGLIPWAEKTLRVLNDQVTSRKGIHRSFLNMSKKWFVGNKPVGQVPAAEKSNIVYTAEAPEMQMRRLADLAFMFQIYELAYQTYHTAKKEFNSEHAWLHFAGALEMASLAVFMLGVYSQRQYPNHYMETAISTYLNTCKSTAFATRSTLLSTEALKSKNLYTEAALQFIKMTSEDSDLRSALLLEQAAHCFIKMKQPMVRKYAFHMILAGHRFSKAGQRRHALRSYSQALQVYKGKDWTLSEDHIHFTLGRQSFNLKQLENATSSFKHLLCADSKQSAPQQNAFLREYLFVFKQQLNQYSPDGSSILSGELPQLPLPVVEGNETKVLCVEGKRNNEDGKISASSVDFDCEASDNGIWQKLEELIVAKNSIIPAGFRPSLYCFTNRTNNSHNPLCVLGEPVTIEVMISNPMKVPLVLLDTTLLWRFLPVKFGEEIPGKPPQIITNENSSNGSKNQFSEEMIRTEVIPEVILQGGESQQVRLKVCAQATGELHITGLAYNLGTSSPSQGPSASDPANITKPSFIAAITVRGKVTLEVQGPRLNTTKEEKASKMYGPDRRLDLHVVPRMPKLEVSFSEFPTSLLCGEVRQINTTLTNTGHHPLTNLKIACTLPSFFTLGNSQACTMNDNSIYRTLVNTSDSDSEEYPVPCPRVQFVMPVELPEGRLCPGQSICLTMWIRGPETPGEHDIYFLFHYLSTETNPKLKSRLLHHKARLMVHQALSLRACATRAQKADSNTDQHQDQDMYLKDIILSLEVQNINNVQDSSITEFSVLQVSCVSCQWHLTHLSTQRHSDIRISSAESTLMCIRASRCRTPLCPNSKKKIFTNVTFDQHQIDSSGTPCAEFYFRSQSDVTFHEVDVEVPKSQLINPITEHKPEPFESLSNAVKLDITLIVLWKAYVVEESGPCSVIQGQHHITLPTLNSPVTAPPQTKMAVELPPMKISREAEEPGPPRPDSMVMSQLLKYQLLYPKHVLHDFSKTRLCRARVGLSLYNCSESMLNVLVDTDPQTDSDSSQKTDILGTGPIPRHYNHPTYPGQPSHAFSWCGRGITSLSLAPGSSHSLPLVACFSQAGVYDLGHLKVISRPSENQDGVRMDWTLQKAQSANLIIISNQDSNKSDQSKIS